jgi:hypothetical protein
VLHSPPISSLLTWSLKSYLEKSTSYEAPHYPVFPNLLSLHSSFTTMNNAKKNVIFVGGRWMKGRMDDRWKGRMEGRLNEWMYG